MKKQISVILSSALLLAGIGLQSAWGKEAAEFRYDEAALPGAKPWTSRELQTKPQEFQLLIIGDRTGGANAEGTFALAIDQINLLQPELVINVGDIIEGYSDDKAELNAEWDEVDAMLAKLDMPFFRVPGNYDIANKVAREVWRERYGATYYHFVYQNVLFLVLDSEDPPREAPEGIKEKLEEYNRLQIEDPPKVQAMLAEFMSDEAVIAALVKPVQLGDAQRALIKNALERNPDVRWTFLFLHEPAWENPSESFKAIQKKELERLVWDVRGGKPTVRIVALQEVNEEEEVTESLGQP